MKQITLINQKKIFIDDDKAENIQNMIEQGAKFIRTGSDMININSISIIGDVDTEKYWGGYKLNPDGRSFQRDGERIYLESHHIKQIEEKPVYAEEVKRIEQ